MTQEAVKARDPYQIESAKRLKDSALWEIQQNYFKHKGVMAWETEVPYFISSNPLVANHYAQLILSFVRDTLREHPEFLSQTFYIKEVGAGLGQFGFYCIHALLRLKTEFNLEGFKFCYILTDVVHKNKQFWQENEQFTAWAKQGLVDFGIYDVESGEDVFLESRNIHLSEILGPVPLTLICNYTFDCIQQDIFELKDGKLHELQLSIKSRFKNYDINRPETLKELKFDFESQPIEASGYYTDPVLNDVLIQYQRNLSGDSIINIPLGAINYINNMKRLTHNNFFMVVGDKGLANPYRMQWLMKDNLMSYDGCYSFMVNFDALARVMQGYGGDGLVTKRGDTFKVCIYSSNHTFSELHDTRLTFNHVLEQLNTGDLSGLNLDFKANCYRFGFSSLLSYLRLSNWDPVVYANIHDRLLEVLDEACCETYMDLLVGVRQVEENFYPGPNKTDVYNLLGIFYQRIKEPEEALRLYNKSLAAFGNTSQTYHNIGMVYDGMGDKQTAIQNFERSISLSDSEEDLSYAKRRIKRLKGQPHQKIRVTLLKAGVVFGVTCLLIYAALSSLFN